MRLTRHNGRSGKNGVYNPKHNDRRFAVESSEHINPEMTKYNVYWDCYQGYSFPKTKEQEDEVQFSFEQVEQAYYADRFFDYCQGQHERNRQSGHSKRDRTPEDLRLDKRTCPEESVLQIGTIEEHVPAEVLAQVVAEFFEEFSRRFGSHIHILDWALHMDEGTPHIQERHVFECENSYGETAPQQEKALEALGFELPEPDKKRSRLNNRKATFDAACRAMLFDIARRHGLHLEEEPAYGGRAYLEKHDYILMKQKEKLGEQATLLSDQQTKIEENTGQIETQKETISQQEEKIERLEMKIDDLDTLLDSVSDIAYETAVEMVTDQVKMETHQEDIRQIESSIAWLESPERKATKKERDYAIARMKGVIGKIQKAMQPTLDRLRERLMKPETKKKAVEQIKAQAKPSVLEMLRRNKAAIDQSEADASRRQQTKKQDMEL